VHGDFTEGEVTDNSSDDMPPLVDAADDSDHNDIEVPALLHNVVLATPTYLISAEICIRYLDDVVRNDNMTTTNDTKDIICYKCNQPCYGTYESHMYECISHIFCAYHNRWEGPSYGYIRCDEASYQRDMASY
jgi:hypothetical protein